MNGGKCEKTKRGGSGMVVTEREETHLDSFEFEWTHLNITEVG